MAGLDPNSDLSSNQTVKALNSRCNSSLPRLRSPWALGPELSRVSRLVSLFQFKEEVEYSWKGLGKLLLMISWLLALSWYRGPEMMGREKEGVFSPLCPVSKIQLYATVTPWPRNTRKEAEDFSSAVLHLPWASEQVSSVSALQLIPEAKAEGSYHKVQVWVRQLGPLPNSRGKISKLIDSLTGS